MPQRIQLRRGNAATWTSVDPVLGQGEIGWEIDTGLHKVGDGSTAWTSLSYSYKEFSHDDLTGYIAAEHYDWTANISGSTIHEDNIPAAALGGGGGGALEWNDAEPQAPERTTEFDHIIYKFTSSSHFVCYIIY